MRYCLGLLCVLLALAACDSNNQPPAAQFSGIDITGADYGKALKLTDHTGKLRTLKDFKGKVVLVFFGFTHCPEVCPTTMHDLAAVMKQLGTDAERVQVLFVTLDPERDTPEMLAKYVPSFRRISKPGQRIYVKSSDIKKSRNGVGIFIVSTPKGIVTGYEAHTLGVGGELLCEVY